jgi:hypothetical protein
LPDVWINNELENVAGKFAVRSTVQLAGAAVTPGGTTISTKVPGASRTLVTVTVTFTDSLDAGARDSDTLTVIGVLGGVA